jgi:hypothetical protein
MPEVAIDPAGQHREVHRETRVGMETVVGRIVYWVFGAIEVLVAIRFALKLFGANPDAGFVQMVYGISGVFMAPFLAVFPSQNVSAAVFEWSALLAIAVYALIAWGIVQLVSAVSPRENVSTVEEQRRD